MRTSLTQDCPLSKVVVCPINPKVVGLVGHDVFHIAHVEHTRAGHLSNSALEAAIHGDLLLWQQQPLPVHVASERQDSPIVSIHALHPVEQREVRCQYLLLLRGDEVVVDGFLWQLAAQVLLDLPKVAGIERPIGEAQHAINTCVRQQVSHRGAQ